MVGSKIIPEQETYRVQNEVTNEVDIWSSYDETNQRLYIFAYNNNNNTGNLTSETLKVNIANIASTLTS